ncbi:uncharacterized protein LOC113351183 [Papaver somniferum]|uniref:uncharacterized protein LOC113351183 n=1 Tax=Papaver somniferum TaxID=3469 RepID=UPI000E6F718C|nr:uncharacterized protein LOC113351183 [Papaver somniferum]
MNLFILQQESYRKRLQELDDEETEDNKLIETLMLVHTGQIPRVTKPRNLKYGISPYVCFMINGHQCTHGYYLEDGIYPKRSILVQCYRQPPAGALGLSYRHFNDAQMALRKDVERAFGILRRKFPIIYGPYRGLSPREMHKAMLTCIILHNMVIQVTRRDSDWINYEYEDLRLEIGPERGRPARDYRQMTNYIQKQNLYDQLRDDLRLNLLAEHGRQ